MSARECLPDTRIVDRGLLRFLTCGSVDDGKSTLIGRLLYDSQAILSDTLLAIERTSKRRGLDAVDLSLLTDGLQAEREQGITIDVAYRYFSTGSRKYIIADAPGHEQYTRNMVTAASTSDLAIVLVDARKGVLKQTRRHACIAHLLGIPHLVVAINKMDLVAYSQACFDRIRRDFLRFAAGLGIRDAHCLPLSALNGDMVVDRGDRLGWYTGPTLMELLESASVAVADPRTPFRFPVQYVCRCSDFRGYMGRIESGAVRVGDEVQVLPSGLKTHVREILLFDRSLPQAHGGRSVTLLLEDALDVSRGDMIVSPADSARTTKLIEATVCWLAEKPLVPGQKLLVRHTTRETKAIVAAIEYRQDIDRLQRISGGQLDKNDIGNITLKLAQPLCVDPYRENRATGAFILIDETTNDTVGAGMIV
jgi:sulfate adenylyltransferase subunit 1